MFYKPKFEEMDFTIRFSNWYDPVESDEFKTKLYNALPREFTSNTFMTTESGARYEILDMGEENGKKIVTVKFHPARYINY